MSTRTEMTSGAFAWRRVHSLMGLWLVIFIIEHLIVNSQAALWIGDDGIGFVRLVNLLEAIPFLPVVESLVIGVPILVHGYWGVKRALEARSNSFKTDGSEPELKYGRSRAFTWQRLTSWILLVGIVAHVIQMRFVQQPEKIHDGFETRYAVEVTDDEGMQHLADRIDVKLLYKDDGLVRVIAKSPGKAMLMMVRDTFKSPLMCVLYTIFVLAATFHAFNGLWTAFITWGVMLSYSSQRKMLPVCWLLMAVLTFLGLAAIWGSYWLNLRS